MADQKISADATVTPAWADFIPIVQWWANKKATIASLPISTLTQSALDGKAPLASPTFTGTVTTPAIKITWGTPWAWKVLTSDADGDATWETVSAWWSAQIEPIADYAWQAVIGVLWTMVFDASKTLSKCTITADSIPVGSNLIVELRKNSYTSWNLLSSTLQIATTDTLTNWKKSVSVTWFSTATVVDWDFVVVYLTSVWSTTPVINPVCSLTFS